MTRESRSLSPPIALPSLSLSLPLRWIIQQQQQEEEGVERYIREVS